MEEAPENGKESSHSAHANGMNVRILAYVLPNGTMEKDELERIWE